MRKSTLFTKQVHFHACKNQIKPQPYPLTSDKNTAPHHNCTADSTLIAPAHASQLQIKLLNFHLEVLEIAEHRS